MVRLTGLNSAGVRGDLCCARAAVPGLIDEWRDGL